MNSIWGPHNDLVNTYASWSFDPTNSVQISLVISFSRTKWQSISVFSSLMKHWIWCNVESSLVVTLHLHGLNFTKVKLPKKLLYPYEFTRERRPCPIFSFNGGSDHYILLLTFLKDNISSKEVTISHSRAFANRGACPISITIPRDLNISFILI